MHGGRQPIVGVAGGAAVAWARTCADACPHGDRKTRPLEHRHIVVAVRRSRRFSGQRDAQMARQCRPASPTILARAWFHVQVVGLRPRRMRLGRDARIQRFFKPYQGRRVRVAATIFPMRSRYGSGDRPGCRLPSVCRLQRHIGADSGRAAAHWSLANAGLHRRGGEHVQCNAGAAARQRMRLDDAAAGADDGAAVEGCREDCPAPACQTSGQHAAWRPAADQREGHDRRCAVP